MSEGCCPNYQNKCNGQDVREGDPLACCYADLGEEVQACATNERKCRNNDKIDSEYLLYFC